MTDTSTPVVDFMSRLLSRGLSRDDALTEARIFEESLRRAATASRSDDERRRIERERKAAWRARKAGHVPGQEALHILTPISSNSQKVLKKERKKESVVPGTVPGTFPVPTDDWPENYLDVFWSKYPPGRKTGKKAVAAKLAGIRKRKEVTFATIMLGVTRYAESGVDPKYTKAPEVWLNKGCWDDEITMFTDAAKRGGNAFAALRSKLAAQQQEGDTRP